MKYAIPLTIAVLAAVAVLLGYSLYNQFGAPKPAPSTKAPPPAASSSQQALPTGSQAQPSQGAGGASGKPPWVATLSATERSFFTIPGADASQEEKESHASLVRKNTQSAGEVSIQKDCQPSPLAFAADNTLTFKVKNTDTVSHTVKIGPTGRYTLAPGESSTVTLEKKGTILGYACDFYSPVGFLVTAP